MNFQLFNPQGIVAAHERDLMVFAITLMLLIVVPVVITGYIFAIRYRDKGKGPGRPDHYAPHSAWRELLWWAIPAVFVVILATVMWKATHELDPYRSLAAEEHQKPLTIQVVALDWKWLFIYPEQNIATVNFIAFPENTPIDFALTAGQAPMNSFWIPQLGGQMYAMSGMETHLHLMANTTGEFAGSAAEISGRGFAGMKFIAKSVSAADFDAWITSVKQSPQSLTRATYDKLEEQSENNPVVLYSSVESDLFNKIIMKYMPPISS